MLFVILQKYDFSSKSQRSVEKRNAKSGCLWYCKSTIFQANHNLGWYTNVSSLLFVILQKYDFSSKSQPRPWCLPSARRCLRYCKSTILQANHNLTVLFHPKSHVVCDTAKVRFFKQITTRQGGARCQRRLFAILQKYDFSSKSQPIMVLNSLIICCLRYCKSTIFQANHN